MAHGCPGILHFLDVFSACMDAVHGDELVGEKSKAFETLDRTLAVLLEGSFYFNARFIDVHVDRSGVFSGEFCAFSQAFVGYGIGSVRSDGCADVFVAFMRFEEFFGPRKVFLVAGAPCRRKSDDDAGDGAAKTGSSESGCGGFGKEVVVGGGGCSAAGHFKAG